MIQFWSWNYLTYDRSVRIILEHRQHSNDDALEEVPDIIGDSAYSPLTAVHTTKPEHIRDF